MNILIYIPRIISSNIVMLIIYIVHAKYKSISSIERKCYDRGVFKMSHDHNLNLSK